MDLLYVSIIVLLILAAVMFALLIVRIEMDSSSPEDVLSQIAVWAVEVAVSVGQGGGESAVEGDAAAAASLSGSVRRRSVFLASGIPPLFGRRGRSGECGG